MGRQGCAILPSIYGEKNIIIKDGSLLFTCLMNMLDQLWF